MKELIEFDVEINPIPIKDEIGKDVTVNFKLYNGFDIDGKFWTDSNGLGMNLRKVKNVTLEDYAMQVVDPKELNYKKIGYNFYPVDSAIVARDFRKTSNL